MTIAIQPAGRRLNHAMTDRLSVHLNGFLGLDHVVDQMESDLVHGGRVGEGHLQRGSAALDGRLRRFA